MNHQHHLEFQVFNYMAVSQNGGIPQNGCFVYNGKSPLKNKMIWGDIATILGNIHINFAQFIHTSTHDDHPPRGASALVHPKEMTYRQDKIMVEKMVDF